MRARFTLGIVLLGGAAFGQAPVWVVDQAGGPGVDFTEIQAAVDAASAGDMILVHSGTYRHFSISGKGLSLFADADADVLVADFTAGPSSSISGVPAGQSMLLRGLVFVPPPYPPVALLTVKNSQGVVWIEDCDVSVGQVAAVRVQSCLSVTFAGCTLDGAGALFLPGLSAMAPSPALRSSSSSTWLYDCSLTGGAGGTGQDPFGTWLAYSGEAAAVISAGTLLAAGSSLEGGAGGNGVIDQATGACVGPGAGGQGLWLQSGDPDAFVFGASLRGGAAGTPAPSCPSAAPGQGLLVDSGASMRFAGVPPKLIVDSVAREGHQLGITFAGQPGAFGLLGVSAGQGSLFVPAASGVLLLEPPVFVLSLGSVPPSGVIGLSILVPALGPGVQGVALYLQGGACDLAAGTCALGSPSVTLLLDASL